MEAALKLARARLMDGAGQQIELGVQTLLMNRVLGMRSELAGRAPSQLFSAMREFGSVREFFTSATIGSLADVPFIFVFLLLVALIAGQRGLASGAGCGADGAARSFPATPHDCPYSKRTGRLVKASRLLHEAIFELDTLKTQRAEDRFAASGSN